MWRTAKKTGLLITSAAAGLATLSQCNAGLFSDLFDKERDKDRQEIEKRLPACDCEFGYFPTTGSRGNLRSNSQAGCSDRTAETRLRHRFRIFIPATVPDRRQHPSALPETRTSPGTMSLLLNQTRSTIELAGSRTAIADSDDAAVRACCDDSSVTFRDAAATG